MTKFLIVTFLLWICLLNHSFAEELPRGSAENCFYVMPLFEQIRVSGSLTYHEKRAQVLKMKEQLGNGNLYHRLGFSFIYEPSADAEVREVCKIAMEEGIHIGIIYALQSHTRNPYRAVADKDFRLYQWRKDGVDWKGSYTSSGNIEVPEDERDYKIPTPSRYASSLREYNARQAVEWAESAKKLMADFPGVVTCINGPIEEELAVGGLSNTDKLADYSPFAITEFRDWLRHSGLYDATSGRYAGEGASSLIIGDLISFNGTLRSQFYDDATPAENNGTGVSFNGFFGTSFTTWSLRYRDLRMYPDPIRDENFDCTPETGTGFCAGGFDAPRILDAGSKFWRAWSYDIPDQAGKYPAGNPESPAYGFRQNLVRNFVRDLADVIASTGIPRTLIYAHQIPGEALGNFTGAGGRNRSSASTVWSGYLEKSQNAGITRFGPIDPVLMTQYAGDWGIFEWHTSPNADPGTQALYTASINALNSYYQNKCHYLYPGWWSVTAPDNSAIFPLNDSRFADAIKDFMRARGEVPYHKQGTIIGYTPPLVSEIKGYADENNTLKISWSERIWKGLLQKWSDWNQFDHFGIQAGTNGSDWIYNWVSTQPVFSILVTEKELYVRIRAVTKNGLTGTWSDAVLVKSAAQNVPLIVTPEFRSMFADPDMENKITVTPGNPNQTPDPAAISVSLSGEGKIINTVPDNLNAVEKFWPMNSLTEVTGIYKLDNVDCTGGVLYGRVSPVTPIDPYFTFTGSVLNGSQLPHIAFRLYSDIPSTGQLYWFLSSGNKVRSFEIKTGWNVYSFSNLTDWISQTAIKSVRLDPGTTASANIALDWFAISSQPVSENLKPSFITEGNKIVFITCPTATPGSYTTTVTMGSSNGSTTVQTLAANQSPQVSLVLPGNDTIVEKGKPVNLMATASDIDGRVKNVRFLTDGNFYDAVSAPPYSAEFASQPAGNYSFRAEATDNAGAIALSPIRVIRVVEQQPFSGSLPVPPVVIQAEDYDTGGDLISFHDSDPANHGGVYRTDPVDVFKISANPQGFYVGKTVQGEWLEYSLDVKKGMKADITLFIASAIGGGLVHLEINDVQVTNHLVVSGTGSDQSFNAFSFRDIYLGAGKQKLKLSIDKGEMNIDYIVIEERFATGTSGIRLTSGKMLYPNPADNYVYLNLDGGHSSRVEMVTLQGQTVRIYRLPPADNPRIPVSGLAPGAYLVRVISDKEIITNRLIKN